MHDFTLAFQSYDYLTNSDAFELFDKKTKGDKDLSYWLYTVHRIRRLILQSGGDLDDVCHTVHKEINRSEAALMFWCLGKQCNSELQLDEIRDAVARTSAMPIGDNDSFQPWPLMLCVIAGRYFDDFAANGGVKKK